MRILAFGYSGPPVRSNYYFEIAPKTCSEQCSTTLTITLGVRVLVLLQVFLLAFGKTLNPKPRKVPPEEPGRRTAAARAPRLGGNCIEQFLDARIFSAVLGGV